MARHHQDGDTILSQLAGLAVDLNGVLVPGRSIEDTLARHVSPLVINNNDDETFKIWLRGSATPVHYRDRDILLTTQHQLRDVDDWQVSMLTDKGSHVVTTAGRRSFDLHQETDAHDIVAFDFNEPSAAWPELKRRFFRLNRSPPPAWSNHILAVLLCGYPYRDQVYDLADNNHLGLGRRHIACTVHSQSPDPALMTVRPTQPLIFDPDGMSGGPAFVIQLEQGRPRAYFAGIVVRGGPTFFHVLKVGFVIQFLESIHNLPAE